MKQKENIIKKIKQLRLIATHDVLKLGNHVQAKTIAKGLIATHDVLKRFKTSCLRLIELRLIATHDVLKLENKA